MDFDVVVVGYGPTGLVLASALGKAGHRVAVFERWPALYGLPRLTHIDGETARIIQSTGDVDQALREASAAEAYEWRNGAGELLLTVDWSGQSSGYAAHYTMYQPHIEDAIDQRVRRCPNVQVDQGTGVVALDQDADGVRLVVRPWRRDRDDQWSAGAEDRTVTARYVVGADGANSFVRTALGIEQVDLGVEDCWLNVDTECVHPLGQEFQVSRQFCDPEQPNMFMPIGKFRQRFEVSVRPGDDPGEMETADWAWRWLRQRHGLGPEDLRILRQIVYTFSARTALSWRRGRVLLAGDAAHTMPPYMGQGACSGMRDSITLSWKLDLVLRGFADETLLDTYEAERRPHVEVVQQCAIELGKIANLKDREAAAIRDAAFRRGEVPPMPPFPTISGGVVHHAPDGELSPLAGTLAPQGVVGSGTVSGRFDDVVGGGFNLVSARDVRARLSGEQQELLTALDMSVATLTPGTPDSVEDVEGTYARYFADTAADTFISRPDFHLYWAGKAEDAPAALDALRIPLCRTGAQTAVATGADT
ncbi:bifunctional 3-(3-hydroxy-phenyl)propionate/3-hydroxycinnamic acid hydroxylase [Sciscionella marina]|uniref:bifunctional 3-(3-hydroxy-phenyl)propionate/3-hydroxycinnamic acid hydroxylase MhpA n=1 Tax=Sciscionella marina TaxID=508770 RepID=UPI0003817F98|nr:bifunctional 3-(3-hydroxy-phenyl)propionate/3-hydroxycinnamic acid hydroxylase [Sciscionella marina]